MSRMSLAKPQERLELQAELWEEDSVVRKGQPLGFLFPVEVTFHVKFTV